MTEIKYISKIKDFLFGIPQSEVDLQDYDQLTIKELEDIFDGGLPEQAFEFLISPPNGKTLSQIREVLYTIADGTYITPKIELYHEPISLPEPELEISIVIPPIDIEKKKRVRIKK